METPFVMYDGADLDWTARLSAVSFGIIDQIFNFFSPLENRERFQHFP